jgi:hypothetical protein
LEGVTERVGAAWVTVTITGVSPVTVTVILATLEEVVVFCVNVAVIEPLPVPEGVTVHHDWLLETAHAELEMTVKEVVPAAAVTGWFEGVTESVGAAWVTVTTTGVIPATVTVILATLEEVVVFCE